MSLDDIYNLINGSLLPSINDGIVPLLEQIRDLLFYVVALLSMLVGYNIFRLFVDALRGK